MRLVTATIMLGVLALAACDRGEDVAAEGSGQPVVETPKRKPGLWVQTTHAEGIGAFPDVSVCIDEKADSQLAWWGQQGVRGGCEKNAVTKNPDGSWSFESFCRTAGNIRTTSKGTASGDFSSAYAVDVETTTEGSPIPDMNGTRKVTMAFEWQGECPRGMKAGDMKLPDGTTVNLLDQAGRLPAP